MPYKQQREPVVLGRGLVVQDVGGPIIRRHNGVHPAIVVDIPDGQTSRRPGLLKHRTRSRRYVYKSLTCVLHQEHGVAIAQVLRCQLNRIKVMPLGNEKIFPAVIVKIEETQSPTGMRTRYLTKARG